jgi:sugar transferase (PEP-CTERM system associated)
MVRILGLFVSTKSFTFFLMESLLFASAWAGATVLRYGEWTAWRIIWPELMLYTLICLCMYTAASLYQSSRALSIRQIFYAIMIATVLSFFSLMALAAIFPMLQLGRGLVAIALILSATATLGVRLIVAGFSLGANFRIRVLVLGSGQEAAEVVRYIAEDAKHTYFLAGICSFDDDNTLRPFAPVMERDLTIMEAVRRTRPDQIVVAIRERRGSVLPLPELLAARLSGVNVVELASFFEQTHGCVKLEHMRASWLIYGDGFRRTFFRGFIKRGFDLLTSLSLLVVALPLMIFTALLVKIDSRGPMLYRQERVGIGGRLFSIYKFRSMRIDAEADGKPQWAKKQDNRITRVGRFIRLTRLDELPQLFNVLRGEMSFVGPRPERPYFVEQLSQSIPYYQARHSIKPGITGWAQVRAGYGASVEDTRTKLEYDIYYLKHHSLYLDLLIILETIGVVVSARGAR